MTTALNLADQTGTPVFHERQTGDCDLAIRRQQYRSEPHVDAVLYSPGRVADHSRALRDQNGIIQFDIPVHDSDDWRFQPATDRVGRMGDDLGSCRKLNL